jgi:hypothetical protein
MAFEENSKFPVSVSGISETFEMLFGFKTQKP